MARIIAGVSDLEAARQIGADRQAAEPRGWALLDGDRLAARVRLEGSGVAVFADAEEKSLEPGEARRMALALLEHADRAERAG